MDDLIKQIIILHSLKYKDKPNEEQTQNVLNQIVNKSRLEQQSLLNKLFHLEEVIYQENEIIDFLTIVKNGEFYYSKIFPKIYEDLNQHLNVRFFIYENNSTDNTKKILEELSSKYENIIIKSENIVVYSSNSDDLCNDRIRNIRIARNNLKKFYINYYFDNPVDNSFVVLWDTDIIFNYDTTIKPLINKLITTPNYSMLLGFGIFAGFNEHFINTLKKPYKTPFDLKYIYYMSIYYYDTLALNYGTFYKKNTINFFHEEMKKVETGFGGIGIIKRNLYITSFYDDYVKKRNFENHYFKDGMMCEHWGFCERLRGYGDIYIVPRAQCLWYQDIDIYQNKELKKYVTYFINKKNLSNIYS